MLSNGEKAIINSKSQFNKLILGKEKDALIEITQKKIYSAIQNFNNARNELDVLLDLCNRILDSKTIKAIESINSSNPAPLPQHQLECMKWSNFGCKQIFKEQLLNFDEFITKCATEIKTNSTFMRSLTALCCSDSDGVLFRQKMLHSIPQLYIDYGFTRFGGTIEGLALVRPVNICSSSDFSLSFPCSQRILKSLKIHIKWLNGNFECIKIGSIQATAFATNENAIGQVKARRASLLNCECYAALKKSFLMNQFQLFGCYDSPLISCYENPKDTFSVVLPIGCAMQVELISCEQDESINLLELMCKKLYCDILLRNESLKG